MMRGAYEDKKTAQIAYFNQAMKTTKGKKGNKLKYSKFNDLYNYDDAIDRIRSNFEPDYEGKHAKKVTKANDFSNRLEEAIRLQKAGKLKSWAKRSKE